MTPTQTQERRELLDQAEQLMRHGFADDAARDAFDSLMARVEAIAAGDSGASSNDEESDSLMTAENARVFGRSRNLGFPNVLYAGSMVIRGESQWRFVFGGGRPLMGADLAQIGHELDRVERHQLAVRAGRMPQRPPFDPNAPETPDEALNRERAEEATKAAEFRGTPAGQMEELIAVNQRIAAALEKGR